MKKFRCQLWRVPKNKKFPEPYYDAFVPYRERPFKIVDIEADSFRDLIWRIINHHRWNDGKRLHRFSIASGVLKKEIDGRSLDDDVLKFDSREPYIDFARLDFDDLRLKKKMRGKTNPQWVYDNIIVPRIGHVECFIYPSISHFSGIEGKEDRWHVLVPLKGRVHVVNDMYRERVVSVFGKLIDPMPLGLGSHFVDQVDNMLAGAFFKGGKGINYN